MTRDFHAEVLAAHDFKDRQKQSASRHAQDKLSCKMKTLKIEVGFWREQSSDASKFQARHDQPSTPGSMRDALSQVLDKMKDADTSLPSDINIDTVSLLRVDNRRNHCKNTGSNLCQSFLVLNLQVQRRMSTSSGAF